MVLAQSLLDDRYDAAIEHLEKALSLMRKRDPRRARTTFVLAQCLRSGGEIERAIEQFQAVADMRWEDYEWVFQGNIQQAMTYERRNGNSEAIVELLEEMLDNKKNDEFQDQIYYALGEVALEDRRRDESFGLFEQSWRPTSTTTGSWARAT